MKNYIKRILSTLLICCLCFSVVGCSNGEEILSVYSEVETVNGGNISEDKETVSSGSQNDSVSTNSSSSSNNANGKFDPYAGIEKYRGKELTFAVWWNMSDQEKKPIQDFYKKYGIKVNVEVIPNESYGSKTASEIASGNGPDIVGTSGEGHLNIIHKGLVQPIDVGCYDLENDDAYDLDVMKALSWKGKMYGINLRNNMTYQRWCIYFNKTMFDNQGVTDPYTLWKQGKWNWTTFADCAKKMTTRKNGKTIYGYTGLNTTIGRGWMLSTGTDYLTTDGYTFKNNLNSDSVLKTLTFVSDLRQAGYWSPDDATTAFYNGGAAMLGEGSWMLEKTQAYWKIEDECGVVPMPCPEGQKEVITHSAQIWCIATGCKSPEAASYFLRYWLDFDNIGLKNAIPDAKAREVFEYMSDASKPRITSVAQSVMGYYDASMYWVMLNVSKKKANDIPVELKSVSSKVDGIISKMLSENK